MSVKSSRTFLWSLYMLSRKIWEDLGFKSRLCLWATVGLLSETFNPIWSRGVVRWLILHSTPTSIPVGICKIILLSLCQVIFVCYIITYHLQSCSLVDSGSRLISGVFRTCQVRCFPFQPVETISWRSADLWPVRADRSRSDSLIKKRVITRPKQPLEVSALYWILSESTYRSEGCSDHQQAVVWIIWGETLWSWRPVWFWKRCVRQPEEEQNSPGRPPWWARWVVPVIPGR